MEEEFVTLAASTGPASVAKALDLVAMELHDTDRALFEAVFLRNDSKIKRLIDEVEAATKGGREILHTLDELKSSVDKARALVKRATKNAAKMKTLIGEVDEIIGLARGE
ncbi:MAG: hypothetical protein AMS22_05745 [Thiotrichales bacterium SG8_50]|nr:MAG: hypothetical protein AMS22_05745 [Thiotrichales bacterium SG8_50]